MIFALLLFVFGAIVDDIWLAGFGITSLFEI
jgi:hypothetical protein